MSTVRIRSEQPGRPDSTGRATGARDRGTDTTAVIVLVLTLACTALALFDLFLLASGI